MKNFFKVIVIAAFCYLISRFMPYPKGFEMFANIGYAVSTAYISVGILERSFSPKKAWNWIVGIYILVFMLVMNTPPAEVGINLVIFGGFAIGLLLAWLFAKSNFPLAFVLLAVWLGVVFYILPEYGSKIPNIPLNQIEWMQGS